MVNPLEKKFLGTSSFVPEMFRPMCFSLNAQGACTFDLFKTHHPMSLKLILLINIISSGHGHSSRKQQRHPSVLDACGGRFLN